MRIFHFSPEGEALERAAPYGYSEMDKQYKMNLLERGLSMSVMELFKLDGKVAYVTGAAQGIGESLATGLAEAGADVAIVDINQEKADQTAAKIAEKTGVKTKAYAFDVTRPENAGKLVEQVVADFGRLDIAFHNAGMAHNVAAEDMSVDEWQKMIDLNLNSVFYGTQAAGRHMLENGGGSIVNTGSMSASIVNVPQPQIHYNAAKAGVVHLSKSFGVEWADRGVRVNSISPGYIGTELLQSEELAPLRKEWEDLTPQRRVGSPDELRGIAVYLASDASSYATASDFIVDGGYTAA